MSSVIWRCRTLSWSSCKIAYCSWVFKVGADASVKVYSLSRTLPSLPNQYSEMFIRKNFYLKESCWKVVFSWTEEVWNRESCWPDWYVIGSVEASKSLMLSVVAWELELSKGNAFIFNRVKLITDDSEYGKRKINLDLLFFELFDSRMKTILLRKTKLLLSITICRFPLTRMYAPLKKKGDKWRNMVGM